MKSNKQPQVISITKMLIGQNPYTKEYMDFFAQPIAFNTYSTQQVFTIVDKSTGMRQAIKSINKNMDSGELLQFLKDYV